MVINPLFTRYLYVKNDIVWTLFYIIVWGDLDQALFWAYELYYSGFQEETFDILIFIYTVCYKHVNPVCISLFLENIHSQWKENPSRDWLLATYVANMIYRKHDLLGFIRKYDAYNYERELEASDLPPVRQLLKKRKIVYVNYSEKDIDKYKTILPSNKLPLSNILSTVKIYVPRTDGADHCSQLRESYLTRYLNIDYSREKIDEMQMDGSWLYYASATPLWEQRIKSYKGTPNHDSQRIDFKSENLKKRFFSLYGYGYI